MGKVTAAVMASTLALSTFSHAAEVVTGDHWHLGKAHRNAAFRATCLTVSV